MFKFLYDLRNIFTPFNIFQYISFRAAYAAVTALLLAFLFGPATIRLLRKLKAGQEVREDGPQTHLKKSGTPTMGGLLINLCIVISSLLWQDLRSIHTWIIIFSVVAFGGLGFLDDSLKIFRKNSVGLRASVKFIGQIVVASIIVLLIYFNGNETTTLLYVPFFKHPVLDLSVLYIPFGVLLLVGTANAVNLTDGLDGLATGLVILVGITFAALAYLTGRFDFATDLNLPFVQNATEFTIVCLGLVGACVGFLWFNAHPAEVMMGDTGSLALGGVIGVIAMLIKKEILLIVVGGVFVLECLSVIIQVVSYKLRKKRVFKMAPLHHHFELIGWAETKVVTRFWILGGLFAILALSTLKIQ